MSLVDWLDYMHFKICCICLLFSTVLLAQPGEGNLPPLSKVSIEPDTDFSGFDLLRTDDKQVFALAEHWHNIRMVPQATLKVLRYLHAEAHVRVLAIEQGASVAYMINSYLQSGDTTRLRQIARNTLFWGKENWSFFENLYAFNQGQQPADRIVVESIDIEYKMASAIFVINELIGGKTIPPPLQSTIGGFQKLFQETRQHREQFQGISVMYYYDRETVENLLLYTINDLNKNPDSYTDFFEEDFIQFATLILDMDDGLTFDYTNPNTNYKFRDRLIYQKFISLHEKYPTEGILCVIGMRHATKGSSIYRLNELRFSPYYNLVSTIRISALFKRLLLSSDLKRINFNYPDQLRKNDATLIRHDPNDTALKSSKDFHYTLFINASGDLTPFENVYKDQD